MFVGGSAGSTGGSIKVVRHLLIGKILRREVVQTMSPELVMPIRLNRAAVQEQTLRAIATFVLLYVGAWVLGTGVIAIDSRSRASRWTARCVRLVGDRARERGTGFGIAGPMGSFADLGDASKVTLIGLMWMGRLEILPVVVLLTRNYWRV